MHAMPVSCGKEVRKFMKKAHRMTPRTFPERLFNVCMAFLLMVTMMPFSAIAYAGSLDARVSSGEVSPQAGEPSLDEGSGALSDRSQAGSGEEVADAQGPGNGLDENVDSQPAVEGSGTTGSPSVSPGVEDGEGLREPKDWSDAMDILSIDGSLKVSSECPDVYKRQAPGRSG